jgi:hypothetical protein
MSRKLGCLVDLPDARDWTVGDSPLAGVMPGALPEVCTEAKEAVDIIGDQASQSCVGWATAQVWYLQAKLGGEAPFFPSPLVTYTLARRYVFGPDTPLPDWGSYPREAYRALAKVGTCARELWPDNGQHTSEDIPVDVFREAADHRLGATAYYAFTTEGAALADQLAQSIANRVYPCMSFEVDEAMSSWAGSEDETLPEDVGPGQGRHYLPIIGYNRRRDAWLTVNSWGLNWGDRGFAWLPSARVLSPSTRDRRVMYLGVK